MTSQPPTSSTAAVDSEAMSRVLAANHATLKRLEVVARRYSSSSASMRSRLCASRRNDCTARMPPSVSTICTMTFAIAVRVRR